LEEPDMEFNEEEKVEREGDAIPITDKDIKMD
jgi:hypothetical protein